MSDDDKDKESKIIKGPWLDNNDISEEVLKEVEKIIEQEKLEKQAKQKPIEEKITIALIEYFQALIFLLESRLLKYLCYPNSLLPGL